MNDIESIKRTFLTLSRFKVKEVFLPHDEYMKLLDIIDRYCDDGGSHNYQQAFEIQPYIHRRKRFFMYGVEVKIQQENKNSFEDSMIFPTATYCPNCGIRLLWEGDG